MYVLDMQRRGGYKQQMWKQKPSDMPSSSMEGPSSAVSEAVTSRLSGLTIAENGGQTCASASSLGFGTLHMANPDPAQGPKAIWKPKSYGTVTGATTKETGDVTPDSMATAVQENASNAATAPNSVALSKLFNGNLLQNFAVDNSTYSLAEVRATFYPKFENEKSDQEVVYYFYIPPHT